MDQDLDDLLDGSSPPTSELNDDVRSALFALVADAEAATATRKRRHGRRLGIAGLASAAVLGLGVAASATGLVSTPWSTTSPTQFGQPGPFLHADLLSGGRDCKVVYIASGFEEPKYPVSAKDRSRAMDFAQKFVLDFDIATISIPQAIERYRADYAKDVASSGIADLPPAQFDLEGTPDDIRTDAVLGELDRRLHTALKQKGLSTHAVDAAALPECAEYFRPQAPDPIPAGRP